MGDLERAMSKIVDAQREAAHLRDRYLGLDSSNELQPVNLPEIAEETVNLIHAEAQRHNIVLRSCAPAKLLPVLAHPSQVRQILLNLTLNAIQQMTLLERQGNVLIAISSAPQDDDLVQIRVIDDGSGIHRHLWEQIFEFGFTTKKEGAGMGLTISRAIAEDLGGRLVLEETHTLWGTTFLWEMPRGNPNG